MFQLDCSVPLLGAGYPAGAVLFDDTVGTFGPYGG
jgi:hypothetical protein